jgi:hypothetical protein
MANDGMARPMFTTETATKAPRRTCPRKTPAGTPTAAANRMATSEMRMCAHMRAGNPLRPDQAASDER